MPKANNSSPIRQLVEALRVKLLDLTARNPLISFKHSTRDSKYVRIIDELPDHLYDRLGSGTSMRFKSLGDEPTEPEDEKSIEFRRALDAAKVEDDEFATKLKELKDGDEGERSSQKLEDELRVRLRERLGMQPRSSLRSSSAAEIAKKRGLNPSYDLPALGTAGEASSKHTDISIQTLLFEEAMQARLSRIRERMRLSISETGVNPLYLAFGFLEWYERDDTQTPHFAPLLVFPLSIERTLHRGNYRFEVQSTGDAAQMNVALRERLKRDFNVVLPEFDEETGTPESYFLAVQEAIESHKDWRIRRWITLGLFSFARIAMWHDLNPENWDEEDLENHPSVKQIYAGEGTSGGVSGDKDGDEDSNDLHNAELDIPLIADADGSQLRAIHDALSGRDMVIEGPPGTGKSQTITNIIAAAIASGKSVLFIAEKMAALDVVRKRLVDAQLGDFCLELHSTKAQRDKVAAALKARMDRRPGRSLKADLNASQGRLRGLRDDLHRCVTALKSPAGNLGITVQQLLWRIHRIRLATATLPTDVDAIRFEAVENLTDVDLGRIVSSAHSVEGARSLVLKSHGSVRSHPWRGIARHDLDMIQLDEIVRLVERLGKQSKSAADVGQRINDVTAWNCGSIAELKSVGEIAGLVLGADVEDSLVTRIAEPQVFATLVKFVDDVETYRKLLSKLEPQFVSSEALYKTTRLEIDRLVESCQNLGLEEQVVRDIPALEAKISAKAEALEVLDRLMQSFRTAWHWDGSTSATIEDKLVQASQHAARSNEAILRQRTPALVTPGVSTIIEKGIARALQLRKQRSQLQEQFVLNTALDIDSLRAHATALRAAGPWPFRTFSRTWREAKLAFRSLRKSPARVAPHVMAASLDEIATFKEAEAAFCSNGDLSRCLGVSQNDIDAEMSPMLDVARWADEMRGAFADDDDISRHICDQLLQAQFESIARIRSIVNDPQFPTLEKVVQISVANDRTLATRLTESRKRLEWIRHCKHSAAALALASNVNLASLGQLGNDIDKLNEVRRRLADCRVVAAALGQRYAEERTDIATMLPSIEYVRHVNELRTPIHLREWLLRTAPRQRLDELRPLADDSRQAVAAIEQTVLDLTDVTPVDFNIWIGTSSPLETAPSDLQAHAERCNQDPHSLANLVEDARCLHEAENEGLGSLFKLLDEHKRPWLELGDAARRIVLQSLLRRLLGDHPALANFVGDRHDKRRTDFRQLDKEVLILTQTCIAQDLLRRHIDPGSNVGPRGQWTGQALIANEAYKQSRHIPIRDLLDRAGDAAQQMMPCFMMSPQSVAQLLEVNGLRFDLVVMDEASQLRPEEALGAIARGRQVVIVGDPKQLPPTNFFMVADDGGGDDDGVGADDEKSVLDRAMPILRPARRLTLHYRSRHPSLIAFSNNEFYDRDLIVFPSPYHEHPDYGVRYVNVPIQANERYKRGRNPTEARHVAEAAIKYATDHPERSLGIVALNAAQAELIAIEIDRLAATNDAFEAWRSLQDGTLEPFFVKNLENVQGDERDAIFISTVFGPDESGNIYQRFGPINNEGGHRRLNVLFTRAKFQTIVFSSMTHSDIRVDETSKRGPRALRGFLRYASEGLLDDSAPSGRAADSEFEVTVGEALRNAGFEIVPQVGVAGYFVDIGVRHPSRPGEFALGIECDGSTYHSTASARERDRIRQEHLERLRWRIHRIWSLDWYRNPTKESDRLMKVLQESIAASA